MKHNNDYINITYALMQVFLIDAERNLVDVSYSFEGNYLTLQIVLTENTTLSKNTSDKINSILNSHIVIMNVLHISKNKFNESLGEWLPKEYSWLKYLLFSKSYLI
jgi:hypothetical protein